MLRDCSPIDIPAFAKAYFGGRWNKNIVAATAWLEALANNNWADDNYSLFNDEKQRDAEPVVYTDMYGKWWTGRYVGTLTFKEVTIDIKPRFGIQFVMNNMPLVNVIGVDIDRAFGKGGQFVQYLQALLWLNQLIKAARHTLPSIKMDKHHESLVCKGRIDVRGTIKQRAKASDKVVSISRYKALVNPVSVAIVLAFNEIKNWLPNHDVMRFLPPLVATRLNQMITAVKRQSRVPSYVELSKVRLSSLAQAYKPLAVMSLDILKRKGVSERDKSQNNKTLLLDVAEVWEFYVLDVLQSVVATSEQSGLTVEYSAQCDGSYLLRGKEGERKLGRLLPDYLLTRFGKTVVIADAKYKRLGDKPWQSPKRDDLYQMTAYLSANPECDRCVVLYPSWDENKSSKVEMNNPWLLASGQSISFVTVSTGKELAVKALSALDIFSEVNQHTSVAG